VAKRLDNIKKRKIEMGKVVKKSDEREMGMREMTRQKIARCSYKIEKGSKEHSVIDEILNYSI
jgi:hypothetical protein